MVSPFEIAINKLWEIGAFQFLFPFILTAAIFYGLLRRSRLFGEPERNVAVNGVVALVAAFMVWAYPVLLNVDIQKQFASFFFGGTVSMLFIIFGLMVVSMVIPEDISKTFGSREKVVIPFLIMGLLIGLGLFFSSGLMGIVFPGVGEMPEDLLYSIITLVFIGAVIIGVIWFTGREEKK